MMPKISTTPPYPLLFKATKSKVISIMVMSWLDTRGDNQLYTGGPDFRGRKGYMVIIISIMWEERVTPQTSRTEGAGSFPSFT